MAMWIVTSSAPNPSSFIQSCFGSSHISLIDSNAHTWNSLLEGTGPLDHCQLPCLESYMTGETFGVVKSEHVLSALPVLVKSVDVLAEGDHEQLGLDPHPIEVKQSSMTCLMIPLCNWMPTCSFSH